MSSLRCVECDDVAVYILGGYSYCYECVKKEREQTKQDTIRSIERMREMFS